MKKTFNDNSYSNRAIDSNNISLLEAIKINKIDLVKELLKKGADINQTDSQGVTPFTWAIQSKNMDMVKILFMTKGIKILSNEKNAYFVDAMQAGSEFFDLISPRLLLSDKEQVSIHVTQANSKGVTPLDCATQNKKDGIVDVLKKLIKATVLDDLIKYEKWDQAKKLLETACDKITDPNNSFLFHAIKTKNIKLVEDLITKGINVDIRSNDGEHPLECAIKFEQWDIAYTLLSKTKETIANIDPENSLLGNAIQEDEDEKVLMLIKKYRANAEHFYTHIQQTALGFAIMIKSSNCALALIPLTKQKIRDVDPENALLKYLIEEDPEEYGSEQDQDIDFVITSGINDDNALSTGLISLEYCMDRKLWDKAEELLRREDQNFADIDSYNRFLTYAKDKKNNDLINLLLKKGIGFISPLSKAIKDESWDVAVEILNDTNEIIEYIDPNNNFLRYAVDKKNWDLVKLLISKGADANTYPI